MPYNKHDQYGNGTINIGKITCKDSSYFLYTPGFLTILLIAQSVKLLYFEKQPCDAKYSCLLFMILSKFNIQQSEVPFVSFFFIHLNKNK